MSCKINYIQQQPITETEKSRLEDVHVGIFQEAKTSGAFRREGDRYVTLKQTYPKATEFIAQINERYQQIVATLPSIGAGKHSLNVNVTPLIEEKDGELFFQSEGVEQSIASEDTIKMVKEAAKKMGIDLQELSKYAASTGLDVKGVNGVADLTKGIIAVAKGKEGVALTEEMVHIATAILEQTNPSLVTEMIAKISRFKIYKTTLEAYKNNKAYQLPDGKPDIRKIKKEAVDKLIAEVIINNAENLEQFPELRTEENLSLIERMWNAVLDWFKGEYTKANIDIFNEVAIAVSSGSVGGSYIRVKEGVSNVFESSPELADIGSKQQYSAYLDTVFPNSKVKDIVYHGSRGVNKIEKFQFSGIEKFSQAALKEENTGMFFTDDIYIAATYGDGTYEGTYKVLLDIKNPIKPKEDVTSVSVKKYIGKHDGVIGLEPDHPGNNYVVFEPEQIHILGSQKDIEGFKQFMKNPPMFFKGDGVFFNLEPNKAVDDFYNKVVGIDERMQLVPQMGDTRRHYKLDGVEIAKSVTEKVKESQNMPERTPEQKIEDDQKREWGSEGHNYIANYITTNLIDKDGYALPTPKKIGVESKLDSRVESKLQGFAKELIASYKPGTRFIIERMVVNEKIKGKMASRMDFMAIEPDGTDVKVDVLDWKFMNIKKRYEDDVPWYKKKEWNSQMREYSMIMYNYGLKPKQLRKARMIPFQANYVDTKKGQHLHSVEIGKLNVKDETNMYLLPVPLDTESTGDVQIDTLVKSLRQYYKNLFKVIVSPEEKSVKNKKMNELSKAIRALHLKKDFLPLYGVGSTFLKSAAESLKVFESINYDTLSEEEIDEKLAELLDFKNSAIKFASLDKVFLSHFPKDGLDTDQKKLLASLEHLSGATERMIDRVVGFEKQFVIWKALKEGVTTEGKEAVILNPEKEIKGMAKSFLEASKLSSRIINLSAKLVQNAKNLMSDGVLKAIDRYTPMLIALEKEAKSKGKSAFDLIGNADGGRLSLIRKIDKGFASKVYEARKKKNKKFFLENINLEGYRAAAKRAMEIRIADVKKQHFSDDEEVNEERKEAAIKKIKRSLSLEAKEFNGWEDFDFKRIFWDTLKEENHLSKEYKEMSPEALAVWNFFTELNQRGRKLGYLTGRNNSSFFPLMEATIAEKLYKTNNILTESGEIFKDLYTVRAEEEGQYSKTDEETGQLKREIPKLFTRTKKDVKQLSTDLNKVGVLWVKALAEYETNKELENTLLVLHSVEKAKGSIITDASNDPVFEAGEVKVKPENTNADLLQTNIDDTIYGIRQNANSLGNIGISKAVKKAAPGKTEEEQEELQVSAKKTLHNANQLVQSLAVGLKFLVAIPNYFGVNMQAFINSGRFMTFKEFEKNNAKITTGIGLSAIDKALLDRIAPINEDITTEARRRLAKKQGFLAYINTWSFHDVMMSTNSFPDRLLQFANALSFIENTMVVDGKLINIRQYVAKQDAEKKEQGISYEERRALEKSYEERVKAIKEEKSLPKIAKLSDEGLGIPGVSDEELAKFKTKIIEYSRNLTGQMSQNNKADYRRDTIFSSFMMFKNWIPKQVGLRTLDIHKNLELDQWEYGRTRAFAKTLHHLGMQNITKLRAIYLGTDEGLAILKEMYDNKKEAYFLKTGQELEITEQEFYDMMRNEITNQLKELSLVIGLFGLFVAIKMAEPPDDEEDTAYLNRYKFWAKASNKIIDELWFYYSPFSFESMTRGSVLPALGLLNKAGRFLEAGVEETYAYSIGDEEMQDKAHPLKYFLNLMPVASQASTELLPLINPEMAKDLGIRVTAEARAMR